MPFGADNNDAATLGAILGMSIPSTAQLGMPGMPGMGGEPSVLMGYEKVRQQLRQPRLEANVSGITTAMVRQQQTVGLSAALNLIYTDPQERKRIAERLVAAGIIPQDWTDQQLASAWANAVRTAADVYAAGKSMTPFDIVALMGQAPGGGGEGTGPRTVVNKQINITTPQEARAILRQVLAAAVGRDVSESELDDFQAQLNQAQRANPSVTTTHYGAGGAQVSSTTTGGVNPQVFAQDFADREFGTEEGDYQVATEFMPELFESLGTPV